MLVMNSFTGKLTQYGMEFPMALTRGEIPIAKRPQEPVKPYPYREEQVVFKNEKAGIRLAGTLTLPQGNGPFPAVVLVSGSGYQDRNEELMEHKPFLVIADALTRSGIAVLRYDDRGVGESEGSTQDNTTQDLSYDAQAALHYLKSRHEISHAGIAGHSEGGAIAFIVAAREPECDFVISLAGPGVSGDKVLSSQQRAIYSTSGIPAAQVEQIVAANRALFDIILASEENDAALRAKIEAMMPGQEAAVDQLLDTWMYHFIKYDPREDIAAVKVPLLALNGTKDVQVICDLNLNAIGAANPNAKIVKFDGLNHLFQHCTTGLPTEYGNIEETIAPEVIDEIVGFIATFAAAK
jgi:pimeloyl-ACP methyl ester carboxylesterase